MTPFELAYHELGIKCGVEWLLTTPSGLYALAVSVVLGVIAAWMTNVEP